MSGPDLDVHCDLRYSVIPGFRPLLLDLVVPRRVDTVPVVAYIHGGGFTVGSHLRAHNRLAAELADALTARGIALASIQYRLSGEAQFPLPVQDVKAAIRWLKRNAGEHGLDPRRVGAFGESAGGYFAAMLATTAHRPEFEGHDDSTGTSSAISAAVSWYGPTHLPTMPALGPTSLGYTDPALAPESRFLGAVVATVPELAENASPVNHVTVGAAPILMLHGTADDGIPIAQSERLLQTYRAVGASAELIAVEGGEHGFHSVDRSSLLARSAEFLERLLT